MKVLLLMICVVIHWFVAFLLMYCCDEPKIWKGDKQIEVKKPSIYDLRDFTDRYTIDKYVEKVINPSYHYFILRGTIAPYDNNGVTGCLSGLMLQSLSLIFIVRNAFKTFPNKDMPTTLYRIIIIGICLTVCCLGCYLIGKLYNKYLALKKFKYDREELREQFIYDETEYDISEENAFNNFIIEYHYGYLLLIEDTVIFRRSIMKIVSAVSAIIYVLFFMRTP